MRMVLPTPQLRYQHYHSSLPNLTGIPVTCTAKLFKTKVEFAFKGTYKDNPGHAKVGEILNWLGDAAFEIYGTIVGTHSLGFIVTNSSPN